MKEKNEEEDETVTSFIETWCLNEMIQGRSQGGVSVGVDGVILVFLSPPNPTFA